MTLFQAGNIHLPKQLSAQPITSENILLQASFINLFSPLSYCKWGLISHYLQCKNYPHMNTEKHSRTALFRGLTVAGLVILLLLLWKQQSELARLKENNQDLQKQNLALLDSSLTPQPASPNAAPAAPAPAPAPTKQKVITASPVPHHSPADQNRLVYSGTEVHQTATGLVATLRFKPSKTGPLGLVLMSVRLPSNIDATIQSIQPAGPAKYEEGESSVSENGRFATFQGTLGDEKDVAISLGVSGSALAFIKGSCGIPSMQLNIQSTNAVATRLER